MRSSLSLSLIVALAAVPRAASAHPFDVYPEHYDLLARPGESPLQHLVLATTYGLVLSDDGGTTWRWVCEAAFGISPVDSWAPEYEVTTSGLLTATTPAGLRTSRDACTWSTPPGPAGEDTAAATAIGPDGRLWLASTGAATTIRWSTDEGASWTPTTALPGEVVWVDTLTVAPADASRLYVTGLELDGTSQPRFWRSDDRGQTWQHLTSATFVTNVGSSFHIAALHPTDPDHFYLRVTDTGATREERLYRTIDGGLSFTEVLVVPEYITGVTVRASGDVLAATYQRGLYQSTDGGATFAPLPTTVGKATCLTELSDNLLYVCADNFTPDFMGLGRAPAPTAWTKLMTMVDLAGPLACPTGTIQRDDCQSNAWCFFKRTYNIASTEITCASDTPDAGTPPPSDPPVCGCGTSPSAPTLLLIPLVAFALRRRARSPSAACAPRAAMTG